MKKGKFFFDHIYKAGGSSIESALVRWLGQSHMAAGLVEPASDALSRYASKALVSGHFSFLPLQWFDPDRYALTMLRDPVDRIVSHYFFAKNNVDVDSRDTSVSLAKSLSFDEYVSSDVPEVRNHLDNFQVRHYCRLAWDGSQELGPDEQLTLAKQGLERYDLVGVLDQIDDFVAVLAIDAGWEPLEQTPHVNVTSARARLPNLDASALERLRDLNRLDAALCEYARELFRRKRRDTLRHLAATLVSSRQHTVSDHRAENPAKPPTKPHPPNGQRLQYGTRRLEILRVTLQAEISTASEVLSGEMISLRVEFRAHHPAEKLVVGMSIHDHDGRKIFGANTKGLGQMLVVTSPGDYFAEFSLRCDLGHGRYRVSASLQPADDPIGTMYHWRDDPCEFSVIGSIGYAWEGLANFYPTLRCGSMDASPATGLRSMDAGADWSRIQRLNIDTPILSEFHADIFLLGQIAEMEPDEVLALEVAVRNAGSQQWVARGLRPVGLSYHWLSDKGEVVTFDGKRTRLPRNIQPTEVVRLWATIKAPSTPGLYTLALSMVQDAVAWFDQAGSPARLLPVRIAQRGIKAALSSAAAK